MSLLNGRQLAVLARYEGIEGEHSAAAVLDVAAYSEACLTLAYRAWQRLLDFGRWSSFGELIADRYDWLSLIEGSGGLGSE